MRTVRPSAAPLQRPSSPLARPAFRGAGGNAAPRPLPIIMQVRVESRRKSFGSSTSGQQGRHSGVVHAVSGSQCADPKENQIFTFQLQHNHLRWSKFSSLTVCRGLKSAQSSRRSCSLDIFPSLLRVGSELEIPPCSAAQFGSAICAIISVLIIQSS